MRAYLSFVLVLLSLTLVFSLLELNLHSHSPKALLVERSYSLSMNVKENILESLRQGAEEGFVDYNEKHELEKCIHCPICHPDVCDPVRCMECFREHEAREQARLCALSRLDGLRGHVFDPDFDISIGDAEIDVFTYAQPLAKNGFGLHSVRIKKDITIRLGSEKFGMTGEARVPGGVSIESAGDG